MKTFILATLILIGCTKPKEPETVQLVVVFDDYQKTIDTLTVSKPYYLGTKGSAFLTEDILYQTIDGDPQAIANRVKYIKEISPNKKTK